MTRDEFFAAKSAGALWDVGVSINRTNPLPLDKNSVFDSYANAVAYAQGVLAYPGQIVAVVGTSTVEAYLITSAGSDAATLVKLAATTASGDLASDVATLQSKVAALEATHAKVGGSGADKDNFKTVAQEAEAAAEAAIAELDVDASAVATVDENNVVTIHSIKEVDGKIAIDEAGVALEEVAKTGAAADVSLADAAGHTDEATVEGAIAEIYGKIETLNGDANTEGSVKKEVATAVAGVVANADASYDTLKEIADWIQSDTTGAASIANDVSALKTRMDTAEADIDAAEGDIDDLEALTAGNFTVGSGDNATTDIKHYIDNADSKKADKVSSATAGNFAGLDANGNLTDSGSKAADFASAEQGAKADSAIQSVKVNGSALTADANKAVDVTVATGSADGTIAVNGADVAVKNVATDAELAAAKTAILGKVGGSGADKDNDYNGTVKGAYDAIAILNGSESSNGSVAKAVKDAVDALDSSATIASKNGDEVVLKAGLVETDGKISNSSDDNITLKAIATKGSADYVTIADVNNRIAASTVEGALDEIAATVNTLNGTVETTGSVKKQISDAVAALDTSSDITVASKDSTTGKVSILAAVKEADGIIAAGSGNAVVLEKVASTGAAADVSVEDTGNKITATNVEGALIELADSIAALNSDDSSDGSVAKKIKSAIEALDAEVSIVDSDSSNPLNITVTEVDGKLTAVSGSIDANTFDAYGAAATAKTAILGKVGGSGANKDDDFNGTVKGAYDDIAAIKDGTSIDSFADVESALAGKQDSITDGSATIASVADGVVTLKAGVAQSGGAIANNSNADIALKKVATTGAAADISIDDEGDQITATTVEAALAELATSISNVSSAGEVTCEKASASDAAAAGVAARYTFKQGGNAIANAVIDIPKDMVVSSGTVETKSAAGAWGAAGTYLVLTLANATNDKVYINAGSLIEYVTSGSGDKDMVKIAVDADHKVTASVTDGSITLAKLADAVQTEIGKAHEHANSDALDLISTESINKWDAAADAVEVLNGDDATDGSVAKSIKDAIEALDVSDTAVANEYVSAVSEADGKISVSRVALPVQAVNDAAEDGKYISAISLNSETHQIEATHVALPTATAEALGLVKVDDSSIQVSDAGVISIKAVSTDLLVQGEDTLILNGGKSN